MFNVTLYFKGEVYIDPLGQPTATACSDHYFCTCFPSVCPSPLFKSSKTKQQKTMFATGVTVGLTEWIIDDTCLVNLIDGQITCMNLINDWTLLIYVYWSPRPVPTVPALVIIIFAHASIRTSVPAFQNNAKNTKIMIATGGTVSLAEGIIDDTVSIWIVTL